MPKHLKKFPRIRTYLELVVENAEAFQTWAIKELKSNNEPLTLNKVKLTAGVIQIPEEYLLEILSTPPKKS
ncbi:hypothetical protein [Candidatus Pristimantibacillus sp. PTI5]|uniref:hypothetical protein n=1 Tax=Candidatus Pristimantibacillus sp. PTI5 TaxID=3400422 RepID=UPI003B015A9D